MVIHIVSRGETIFSIAQKYGVSAEILAFNNDINIQNPLPVGQPLAVVVPTIVHTVSEGQSLEEIANFHGVSIYSIWRNNPILNGSSAIFPGQTLYIEVERESINDKWKS